MNEQSKLAQDWWVVVRMDNHYNEVVVPLENGKYFASEADAKKRAQELHNQTHTPDHVHKQSFCAEKYDPESHINFG